MTQYVYSFGPKGSEGAASMKSLLGGKGANLAEMANLGLPVPPGLTITTECCRAYNDGGNTLPAGVMDSVMEALAKVEGITGKQFGGDDPLLLSVRSGAAVSMPGMMDTVLNLGLNTMTVEALANKAGDARFAWDSYRRFIQMFADVVLELDSFTFEQMLDEKKLMLGIVEDTALSAEDLQDLANEFMQVVADETGKPFPQDPREQLEMAIRAVFNSWMNPRAITYRDIHEISGLAGTAVTVQAMVFGNRGDDCATGVAFTRNPSTGAAGIFGEYLINAQGEDVVAGIRTPLPIAQAAETETETGKSMEAVMPELFREFLALAEKLEAHYRDMQDIEFTIEKGQLWMLQTRNGKRSAAAAVSLAVAFANAGIITQAEAVKRVDALSLEQLLHPMIDQNAEITVLGRGLPASPGAACGKIVFDAEEAHEAAANGESVILVREETSPEDIQGMHAAMGILTARGGMTSHAAVVARGMGKPCVCGASSLRINEAAGTLVLANETLRKGDIITLDGSKGEIYAGELPMAAPALSDDFETLMGWADSHRTLQVRANAETIEDIQTALEFGAEGIGLCRTEHMFFQPERITAMRGYILAEDENLKARLLTQLAEFQKHDFKAIFELMREKPVTVRLLDPPLHEFLPHDAASLAEVAKLTGLSAEILEKRTEALSETNPMLGHRGVRLGMTHPKLYEAQIRAILEAAIETGEEVVPEIMVPLVMSTEELRILRDVTRDIADQLGTQNYLFGTMIELPGAALIADELAEIADFFSFGTNDLTQTTLGMSRDDTGALLQKYRDLGIIDRDPFMALDQARVGKLVQLATEKARAVKPDIKLSVCGEQGADPESIAFCHRIGLDTVSCSPYRVPVARLAAGQNTADEASKAAAA
ncbi:MAG: pyruvate, phosphate dikinase [Rickettsiales bacterium]|nr:pyruvate, phosphate dikinase [Rickettsiales bacterium]